jgi:hypothetical protein
MYFMPQRFPPPWTVERIEGGNESAELLLQLGSAPFCPLSWIAHQ